MAKVGILECVIHAAIPSLQIVLQFPDSDSRGAIVDVVEDLVRRRAIIRIGSHSPVTVLDFALAGRVDVIDQAGWSQPRAPGWSTVFTTVEHLARAAQ